MEQCAKSVEEYTHKNKSKFIKFYEATYDPNQMFRSGVITFNNNKAGCYIVSEQTIKSQYLFNLSVGDTSGSKFSWPVEATFIHIASSPNGQYVAFAYNPKAPSNKSQILVYDTQSNGVCITMEIDPNIHTEFWTELTNFKFSPCNEKLMYCAQQGGSTHLKISDYEYKDYFGEDYDNLTHCGIYIFHFNNEMITHIEPYNDTHTYADPNWFPNSKGFMCTAYSTEPWRLFLQKCLPSQVYLGFFTHSIENSTKAVCEWMCISDPETESSAWAGVVAKSTDTHIELYYYSLPNNGIQHPSLNVIPDLWKVILNYNQKWQITSKTQIFDRTNNYTHTNGFQCLYSPSSVLYYANNNLFTNTFSGPSGSIYCLDTEKMNKAYRLKLKNVNDFISNFNEFDSLDLMDIKGDYLLINHSSPISPSKGLLAKWSCEFDESGYFYAEIECVVSPSYGSNKSQLSKWNIFNSNFKDKQYGVYQGKHPYIQNTHTHNQTVPLVVNLHGGPFTTLPTRFIKDLFYLSELGFDIISPNYPASIGFGLDYMQSIYGKAGKFEVKYINDLINEFVNENSERYEMSKLIAIGISYGGFLTCHLLGQFPSLFKVASCRNPLLNVLHFYTATDVQNWAFGLILDGKFSYDKYLNKNEIEKMNESSPTTHINNIQTPLLIAVGEHDIRVPNKTSIEFYHILKSQGKQIKLLFGPGRHLLKPPKINSEYWQITAIWFCYYLNHNPF